VIGEVSGSGRKLFVAYVAQRSGETLELYPVHARQIGERTWRKLRESR
jgi:hypothetical protein